MWAFNYDFSFTSVAFEIGSESMCCIIVLVNEKGNIKRFCVLFHEKDLRGNREKRRPFPERVIKQRHDLLLGGYGFQR